MERDGVVQMAFPLDADLRITFLESLNEETALKRVYIAISEPSTKWTKPLHTWN